MTPQEHQKHLAYWPTGGVWHKNVPHPPDGRFVHFRYTSLGDRFLTEVQSLDGSWRELVAGASLSYDTDYHDHPLDTEQATT